MWTVWTNPSTARKGGNPMISPGEAVAAGLSPVLTSAVLTAAPGMPLAGALRTTVAAGSVMGVMKRITDGMSSEDRRTGITKRIDGTTFYEHATHSGSSDAQTQARALRKQGFKAKVTKE